MPLYEYECERCGHEFEDFRSMSARETLATCPECGEEAGRLRLSACAVVGSRGAGSNASCAPGGG